MTGAVRATKIAELAQQMLIITRRLPLTGTYTRIDELNALFQSIQHDHGAHTLEAAARCLLLKMTDGTCWVPHCQVPDSIRTQVIYQRERIQREAIEKPLGHYHPLKELFLMDFSLLRGKTLPLKCIMLDTLAILWRRPPLNSSLAQRLQYLRLLLRKPLGTRYFLQIHGHPAMLDTFTEAGWHKNYHMVCDFLAINPGYKGLTGTSWVYDPAIEQLSPPLAYISRDPTKGGAKRYLSEGETFGNVLASITDGKEQHGEHQVTAQTYMLVWHRKALLNWRRRQQPTMQ